MEVKLTCNWCRDEELFERFQACYTSNFNINPDICFTNSNKFDWLVVINYPHYHINFPKEKTLGVIMEPSWTKHYENRHALERICSHILCHKKQFNNPQYIFYPGLLPFHLDYKNGNNLDYFVNTTFPKIKKCSMVVSYSETNSHNDCIYKQRTDFAKQILQTNLDVDIYGNGWERSGLIDQRIKGQILNKKDALVDYNFSIAIENCVEQGYFTEKFTDCVLADATPIYYGCPDIYKYYTNCYKLTNLNNIVELEEILNKSPLPQHKELTATKFNLYYAICSYINRIS
jgi:hypothetical protein